MTTELAGAGSSTGEVTLRPLATSDAEAWRRARQRNAAWLVPWDATVPPGGEARPTSFKALVRRLARQARQGTTFPFAIEVDGGFAGQVTVNNIVRGSAQFASVGYWLDQDVRRPRGDAARRGDGDRPLLLHRRAAPGRDRDPPGELQLPARGREARRSARSATRRKYLHIDGAWRDHRLYALTKEEVPDGVLARLRASGGATSHTEPQ